jgi:hypothetical protein
VKKPVVTPPASSSTRRQRRRVLADAEARRIALTVMRRPASHGKANAVYQLRSTPGGDNFTRTKIAEIIGKDKRRSCRTSSSPAATASSGALSGLLGMAHGRARRKITPTCRPPPVPLTVKPLEPQPKLVNKPWPDALHSPRCIVKSGQVHQKPHSFRTSPTISAGTAGDLISMGKHQPS